MSLKDQMKATAELIEKQVGPGFSVHVKPVGMIGAKPGHWLVSAKLHGADQDVPARVTMEFNGNLTPGSLAHAAAAWLRNFGHAVRQHDAGR